MMINCASAPEALLLFDGLLLVDVVVERLTAFMQMRILRLPRRRHMREGNPAWSKSDDTAAIYR